MAGLTSFASTGCLGSNRYFSLCWDRRAGYQCTWYQHIWFRCSWSSIWIELEFVAAFTEKSYYFQINRLHLPHVN